MQITLGGRSVKIDSFHVTGTYGGMLEGLPDRELNDRLVKERVPRTVEKMWGPGRKIHVVHPTVKPAEGLGYEAFGRLPKAELERFPDWECYAWLASGEMKKEAHGSHAFLVWWTDDVTGRWISKIVEEAIAGTGLKWEEIAEDYYV